MTTRGDGSCLVGDNVPLSTGEIVAATTVLVGVMFFNAFPTPPFVPLGRTTATLLGAAFMVFLSVVSGDEAYALIDTNTLAFLFGMMAVKCLLEKHQYVIIIFVFVRGEVGGEGYH